MRSPHYLSGLQFFLTFETGWVCIRFTLYTPDGTPLPLHLVLILRIGRIAARFSNFKKTKPNNLIRVPIQKLQKNPQNAKILLPRRSMPSINTAHSSEYYPYHSITLETFKNDTKKEIFEKKCTAVYRER